MAAARQNEMKVSITDVATTTGMRDEPAAMDSDVSGEPSEAIPHPMDGALYTHAKNRRRHAPNRNNRPSRSISTGVVDALRGFPDPGSCETSVLSCSTWVKVLLSID